MNTVAKQFFKEPVWRPDEKSGETMKQFIRTVEKKYNLEFSGYWDFHKWTVENSAEFWAEIWDFIGIIYSKPYDQVVDLSIPMEKIPKWFEGARLNFAENILRHRGDQTALILAGEDRGVERLTYKQVYEETRAYASALRKIGLKKGDRVACYMSHRKEALLAMLAATSIGAIWTAGLPMLECQEFLNRMKQVKPKILFTVDQFTFNMKTCDLLQNVKDVVKGLPSLEKVIIVPSKPVSKSKEISDMKNSCFLDEFLETAKKTNGTIPEMVFEQVSFSHPVFISFTSGTTGLPKTLVHGFGGLLSMCRDHMLHNDIHENDVFLSICPPGWVGWNIGVAMLYIGSTVVLYEGFPFFLNSTYLWDIIDDLNITTFLVTPSILELLQARNFVPAARHHLSSLNKIMISGSVLKPCTYDFCLKLKDGIRLIDLYGCTELMVLCLVSDATLPLHVGECSSPALGIAFECLDEEGNHVKGEMGELVITKSVPSLALGFWGDDSGDLFRKSYFSKHAGKFVTGDMIIINPITKGVTVCGRSEETIKQRGCRFGSNEIYNIVNTFPEVRDSLCVGQLGKEGDERAVLFLEMEKSNSLNEDLVKNIQKRIEKELSAKHVPEIVIQAPNIPYNTNFKKTEIIVKKIINKMPHNPSTVVNPECLKFYYDIPELQGF